MSRRNAARLQPRPGSPFRAITIVPNASMPAELGIRRDRLIETLNTYPTAGSIGLIYGPPGAGKTTLAMQWIEANGRPCQYVSASSHDVIPDGWIAAPNELGTALAEMLNLCLRPFASADPSALAEELESIIEILESTNEELVIDGFEPADRAIVERLLRAYSEQLSRGITSQGLIILGPDSPHDFELLGSLGNLRLTHPSDLAFTHQEVLDLASFLEVPGDLPSKVDRAVQESGGWIFGLDLLLRHDQIDCAAEARIDRLLMDHMLLALPSQLRRFVLTAIGLPRNDLDLWHHLFAALQLPQLEAWYLRSMLPQIPSSIHGDNLALPPLVRQSLLRLRSIDEDPCFSDAVAAESLRYFAQVGDIASYQAASQYPGASRQAIRALRPHWQRLVDNEQWNEFVTWIRGIEPSIAVADHELVYWSHIAEIVLNIQEELIPGAHAIFLEWTESTDPLSKARGLSYRARLLSLRGDLRNAVRLASEAYDLLANSPADSITRANATAIAAKNSLILRAGQTSSEWLGRLNAEMEGFPSHRTWIRHILLPLVLSAYALTGDLDEVFDICEIHVRRKEHKSPERTVPFLVLQAAVRIEQRDLTAAAKLLRMARSRAPLPIHEPAIALAEVQLRLANMQASPPDLRLSDPNLTDAMQIVQTAYPNVSYAARIHLQNGDPELAMKRLQLESRFTTNWPSQLGEDHPVVQRGQILAFQGRCQESIRVVTDILTDALYRGHRVIAVSCLSTLAFIHQCMGSAKARDENIVRALQIAEGTGISNSFYVAGLDVRTIHGQAISAPTDEGEQFQVAAGPMVIDLTSREREMLEWAALGLKNTEIAERMFISVSTVKTHMANAFSKLGAKSRSEAVSRARLAGYLSK